MKSIQKYIEDVTNDEIHLILQSCHVHAGDLAYDDRYERLRHEILSTRERNWDYEYDQYCIFMRRLFRETNYREDMYG